MLYVDSKRKVIYPPEGSNKKALSLSGIERIAIIPLKIESCCENDPTIIKGFDALKQRHLEILGYKVVHINYRMWHSMYLSVPGARLEYMKQVIGVDC